MAGMDPKPEASMRKLAHCAILAANNITAAQPIKQDKAIRDAAQAAVGLVEDDPLISIIVIQFTCVAAHRRFFRVALRGGSPTIPRIMVTENKRIEDNPPSAQLAVSAPPSPDNSSASPSPDNSSASPSPDNPSAEGEAVGGGAVGGGAAQSSMQTKKTVGTITSTSQMKTTAPRSVLRAEDVEGAGEEGTEGGAVEGGAVEGGAVEGGAAQSSMLPRRKRPWRKRPWREGPWREGPWREGPHSPACYRGGRGRGGRGRGGRGRGGRGRGGRGRGERGRTVQHATEEEEAVEGGGRGGRGRGVRGRTVQHATEEDGGYHHEPSTDEDDGTELRPARRGRGGRGGRGRGGTGRGGRGRTVQHANEEDGGYHHEPFTDEDDGTEVRPARRGRGLRGLSEKYDERVTMKPETYRIGIEGVKRYRQNDVDELEQFQ
ncbi:ribosome-binding protein 1-like [Branchiostoma floridae]|uniref:Ribosome-binding protein 1-like n=1 Tax=Branchiostoma floridae TaxID=7739 RepID=A0A9J7MV04_BRAFL|nr:ribosome-binding protein 1-like [Branchiostoma floridae]